MPSSLNFRNLEGFHIFTDSESKRDVLEIDYESYSKYWYIQDNEIAIANSEEEMHNHCFTGSLGYVYFHNFEHKICTQKYTFVIFEYEDNGEAAMTILNNDNMVDKDRLSKLSVYY
jgi:hypothetical protein